MKKILFFIGVVAMLALAGCTIFEDVPPADNGTGAGTTTNENIIPGTTSSPLSEAPQEINMVAAENSFIPAKLTLKLNKPVKLIFNNTGDHNFKIDELGIDAQLTGSSTSVEFTPVKTGMFEFYCTAQKEAGMKGTLTVTE